MPSSVSCGYPLYTDGGYYPMALWREFDGGTAVIDNGTAAAAAPIAGVYPGANTPLKVSAGTGMTVKVNAGYCCVPNSGGTGAYRFGLMAQATLTVASNSTGSTRKDYVFANVQDLNTTGSSAQVEYVTGTTSPPVVPANSVILAEVDVTNGASSITAGMITDKRSYAVAPGGILPIAALGNAIAVPTGQLMYDIATGQLIYSPVTVVSTVLTGSGNWTCPAGTTTVNVQCYAGGAGGTSPGGSGLNGSGGGGGGGEYAAETALAVTAGHSYAYSQGQGGNGGGPGIDVSSGTDSTFAGDSVLVRAHGGINTTALASAGGTPGTGSTNTFHNDGGAGGSSFVNYQAGGGGGASGSVSSAGGAGHAAGPGSAGLGGLATAGGGNGGTGGHVGFGGATGNALPGSAPGGGGGGAGKNGSNGAPGANGTILLSYTIAPGPSAYPLVPPLTAWFARQSSAGVLATAGAYPVAITQLTMTADGSSNYVFEAGTLSVASTSGTVPASLSLLIDGYQADAITLSVNTTGREDANWSYYTSGAQGTTLRPGNHVITFAVSCGFGTVQASGPAFLRVARTLS